MGTTLVAKLDSAARGGEAFTPCMMWENSLRLTATKRQKDLKRSCELLDIRDAADKRARQKSNERGDDKKTKR